MMTDRLQTVMEKQRIQACVKACAGIETEVLEKYGKGFPALVNMNARLIAERDEIKGVAEMLLSLLAETETPDVERLAKAREVIYG